MARPRSPAVGRRAGPCRRARGCPKAGSLGCSAGRALQCLRQRSRLVGRQLDDQATASLERYAHDQASPLLGDLEGTFTRARLHGLHACLLRGRPTATEAEVSAASVDAVLLVNDPV